MTSALPSRQTRGDGDLNTGIGDTALYNNSGTNNTATGYATLVSNESGNQNTATGSYAMESNLFGSSNTANGFQALYSNSDGDSNTASGTNALYKNTSGNNNTALGVSALTGNTTGDTNIAIGFSAGRELTTGSNNIDIANVGVAGESKAIRIGTKTTHRATYIAGISGATVAGGVGVIIDTNGHLGTGTSSERYKDKIKPMDKTSEAILSLQPVTFGYKHELDPEAIPQFGLVAEQVEKVNPDLVARDGQGKPYTVRYEAVNAMLLNEFLKAHRKVEAQEATITQLKEADMKLAAIVAAQQATKAEEQKEIQTLTESLKEEAFRIQKVSDELEANKAAPRVVANDQ